MSPLRFGILGAATIASKYTAAALQAADSTEFVAVAARDPQRASDLASQFGARTFDSYDALITDPGIDAVYIPLPIGLHAKWALAALESGKHVLSEKSLTPGHISALAVIEAARQSNLALMENFMCERHAQNQFAKDCVASGSLGSIRQLSLAFGFPPFADTDLKYNGALGGGALNDAGAYCVDMAMFYLGALPESVTARLRRGQRDVDSSVDVEGTATLDFADSTAHLTFGFQHDYRNDVRIWGSQGQLEIDRAFSIPPDRVPDVRVTRNTVVERIDLPAFNHFVATFDAFASIARNGGSEGELDKLEAQATVMEAVRVSSAQRRTVDLSEFDGWESLAARIAGAAAYGD